MTKIVHEFCGICIQRRYIAGCSSGVWSGGLRFGEESCLCGSSYTLGMLHLFCIARHSLLVVGRVAGSNHSPPVRLRGVQRNSLSPRQVPPAAVALRNAPAGAALGAPAVFCIALCAIARHSRLGVRRGYWRYSFAACSAAGEQRNSLSPRQVPPAAVALRNAPAGAALGAPAVFCIALCAIARHSRAGKKNGSRQGQRLPGAMLPFRFLTP